MSNVIINKDKLDTLATAISLKTGDDLPLTLAEMTEAVDDIIVPSGTKSISANGTGIDVTAYASVDVAVEGESINDKFITVTFINHLETGSVTLVYILASNVVGTSNYVEMTLSASMLADTYSTRLMPYGFGLAVRTAITNSNTQNFELRMNNVVIDPKIEGKSGYQYFKYYNISKSNLDSSNNVIDFYSIQDAFKDTVITDILTATANDTYTAPSGTAYSSVTVNVPTSSPSLQAKTNITPTTSSQTITADSGYDGLSSVQINAMPSGSATTPATTITANPTISISGTGLITATTSASQNVTPTVSAGYVSSGTAGTVTVSGSNTSQLSTQAATTIIPTESSQTAVAAGKYTTGAVTVAAIPSNYVGSGIDQRDGTDLTVSGATVTVPAGYYASQETKSVASGTEGTPTATKGMVSNHAISVTPSVTNTAGYISGGTKTGTAISVAASELVSGTLTIDSSGTKDVTNYASASVAAGAVTAPSSISGTAASVSTGTNTLTLSKTVSVTPNVTAAGYISSGTAGNSSVSLTANVTTKAAATITPGTTNQTIASGTYLTGAQTISGDANLVASNIISGKSIFGVAGSVAFQTIYTGSSTPSSSTGVNGDIYIKTS